MITPDMNAASSVEPTVLTDEVSPPKSDWSCSELRLRRFSSSEPPEEPPDDEPLSEPAESSLLRRSSSRGSTVSVRSTV
ncbi:MAG: hypothetical protein R2716_12000 [Microthrixaceae bacterium]